ARQVTQRLPTDGIHRAKDHNLAVFLTLKDCFEPSTQGKRGLAGTSAATDGDNPHGRIGEHIKCNALFGRTALQTKGINITADELDCSIGHYPAQGGLLVRL